MPAEIDDLRRKSAGYYSLADLAAMSGLAESDLRRRAEMLGIAIEHRYAQEVMAVENARRLLERLSGIQLERMSPGFSVPRLVALMLRAIAATRLNLSSMTLLTEAASGAYGVTPIIAAIAGARQVYAFTRSSRYGSASEVKKWTLQLAHAAGVSNRIDVIEEISPAILDHVDIVTNSGHLRPLTSAVIDRLPSHAVIALMFEAWEFRSEDIDLQACVRRGIPVVGVNERHPSINVFSFLGPLCVKQLHDCGIAVCRDRIAVVCDNGFAEYMARGLVGLGARVEMFADVAGVYPKKWDAVVLALLPASKPRIGAAEAQHLAAVTPPEAVVVQFWGDIDRQAAMAHGLNVWPARPPSAGHMAVLLSEIGPEPIVRLQTGGLRAAEWIRRGGAATPDGFAQLVQPT